MDDYYRLLDIDEQLDSQQIARYLYTLNREVRQRANHRDARVREEALAKLQQIGLAMAQLGPDSDRAAYDRELAGFRAEQELQQPLADMDFYQLLQLSVNADTAQIQKALAAAEMRLGAAQPDETGAVVRQRKLLALARRTLLDDNRRQAYDADLQAKQLFAARRDAAKPVPLHVNGQEVYSWHELEPALDRHPAKALALLQDGEIEAWLRWSLDQRQRAHWVRRLAERTVESTTPIMELEEFLRLLNEQRPFRLYAAGSDAADQPVARIDRVSDLPAVADAHWSHCIAQIEYLWTWVPLRGGAEIAQRLADLPASEDPHIQLERLLAAGDPKLPPPELVIDGAEQGTLDFGTVQAWESPRKRLTLRKQGRGHLYGTIAASAPWIMLSRDDFSGGETVVEVRIHTAKLTAGQPQQGQITCIPVDGRGPAMVIAVHVQSRSLFQSVKSLFRRGES